MPFRAVLLLLGAVITVNAAEPWPFPTTVGTTWRYAFTREPEREEAVLTRQIASSPKTNEESLRIEQRWDGTLKFSEWLRRQKGDVLATAERVADGTSIVLNPPVTIIPSKLESGASWNFRGEIAGAALTLPMKTLGEEEIQVAAGKFRAWHIRGEQSGMVTTVAEQWFAPGIGFVKEMVTQRSPSGQLIDRRAIQMTTLPSVQTIAGLLPPARPFEASLSTSTAGAATDVISADALQIVARWRVHREIGTAKVRAVWIAEDTGGIVPANYQVDEATAVATPPESVGTFTLSRPADGWAAGKYRVEFYVQNALVSTQRLTIVGRAVTASVDGNF